MPLSSRSEPRERWREHVGAQSTTPPTTIGVAASFTVNPLEPHLGCALLDAGVRNPRLLLAGYNVVHQACLDPAAAFCEMPERLLLLWRLEDVFEADIARLLTDDETATRRLLDHVAELIDLVAQCARQHRHPIAFGIPPFPRVVGVDPLDVQTASVLGALHATAVGMVHDSLGTANAIRLVDHRRLVDDIGGRNAHDDRGQLLYRQPYTTVMIEALARLSGEAIAMLDVVPPKVLVLDLDNTLWGGIVEEQGIDNVAIGNTFPGNAFTAFQRELLRLKGRGIFLSVCSKNDIELVEEMFRKRSDMVLSKDDFVTWRVNWKPKSVNIASIAEELNVGLESVLFVDDSEFELAEVAAALPSVRSLRVPDDPAELPGMIAATGLFRSLRSSDEDRQRTDMMHAERRRTATSAATSAGEFLASLELVVHFFRVDESRIGRVTQLINKTNQFNLTTRRRNEAEVAAIIASADYVVHAIEVADKFGGYGLVGVAVTARGHDGSWSIDTFLLSCRVLARGVESAFLSALVDDIRRSSKVLVFANYVPSARNSQVAEFYVDHGFVAAGIGKFVLAEDRDVFVPSHIQLVSDA